MLKRFWYWIKKNLVLVVISIFLLIFIVTFSKLNWNYILAASVEGKTNMLTNIFIVFAAVWAVYEFARKNRRARAEKAIELAKEFEKDIIPLINEMTGVFNSLSFYKKIKDLYMHDGLFFDREELRTIFSDNEINEYVEFCRKSTLGENPISILICQVQILNKLEAFSMAFNHKVADESVVYQSLHQMFFTTVKTLYIKIAIVNEYEKDKYYTNIIKLFNDWDKRYKKIERKNKKRKEKILNNFKEV